MARASSASRAGLDVKLGQLKDGTWRIVLTDSEGSVVYDRTHNTEIMAKQRSREWVQENYQVEVQEVHRPTQRAKAKPRNLGPQPTHLIQMMRDRADDNEEKAIQMRASADGLEAEAKRLREAADSLEGPDGQSQST